MGTGTGTGIGTKVWIEKLRLAALELRRIRGLDRRG